MMSIYKYLFSGLIAATLLLLPAITVFAQDRPERPEMIEFPELNPITPPDVQTFEFNGIQFFLVEDDELPLISMSVRIKAGSWLEDDKPGLASITGEVMRSGGTKSLGADELNELLENNAVSMETSFGTTSGTANLNLLSEDFEEMLPVFIELLTDPAFPEDKFELAKTQRRSGISRRNDSPAGIAAREFRNLIYGTDNVYSQTLEYDHLNRIELDDLVAFHRNAITNRNLMVGITGDFTVAEIRPLLEEAFAAIPEGPENEFDFPEIDYEFMTSVNFVNRSDMNQSIIRMGHIGGFRDNPDYAALQVMNQILSGGFSGRLMQEVRTRLGLAYGVSGSYGSSVLYPGQFFTGLSTAGESTADAIRATLNEIRKLQEEPVPQEELDDTRDRFLNSLVFRNENRASALFEQLNNTYLGLPLDAFEQYVEEVRRVTPEDIHRVAREYLRPDQVHILVVGNRELVGDQLDEFGDVNEIDITIPRPGELSEAEPEAEITGDAVAGAEWLARMSESLLNGKTVSQIRYKGDAEISTPGGMMKLAGEMTYGFPGYLKQEFNTPMGSQILLFEDGSAKMQMGGQEQNLGAAAAEQFENSVNRHYLNLAMKAGELNGLYTGTETVNEKEVAVVYLTDYEMNIKIDTETGLPVQVTYDQFDGSAGQDVEVQVNYSNFNESGGVMAAWYQEIVSGGETQLTFTTKEHSVE